MEVADTVFYDWITCYQDFNFELPVVVADVYQRLNVETGEFGKIIQPRFQHEGSYCSTIAIAISGSRITMSGNPSKYNRLDNVMGLHTLDDCVRVFNSILLELGLPPFTKCTKTYQRQGVDGDKVQIFSDGCTFTRIDVTSNKTTGGFANDYIKGLSTLRVANSIPELFTNGCGCHWLTTKGNAPLIYHKVYNKANELQMFALPKVKSKFGQSSPEYEYIKNLIAHCQENGVVRFEQGIKAEKLSRENCRFWGLFDENRIKKLHDSFVNIDERLQVTAMNLESISEHLISTGLCSSTKAANTTAMYALEWAHGKEFDFSKRQVKEHRSRLRKIGIDIKNTFDASRFSPVVITKTTEIEVSDLVMPPWYKSPTANHLRLVA